MYGLKRSAKSPAKSPFVASGTPWTRLASPTPQISDAPVLPTVFAHIQVVRHRGLALFSRHSNETTRMIRNTSTSSNAR